MPTDTFKGITITIGADTKQFNKEMKALDKSIAETNRSVEEFKKGLAIEFDSKRFTEAQRLAQEAIDGTNVRAKALKEELNYLENSGADKNSDKYKRLQTELIKTENNAILLKKQLEEINNLKIENLSKQFERTGQSITKVGQALQPLSIAAGGVLAGFGAMGLSAVKTADDISTLAQRINLTAEELQKWQYIAMQTDVSNEELQQGFTKVQKSLGDLATGETNKATEALEVLGVSSVEASQGMEKNFSKIVERLSQINDPILQASYANELFGEKLGSKLIPMLKSGGEGIKQLGLEFEQFSHLTNEQIAALSDFDNTMNRIKYALKTMKDQIGASLLPIMQVLSDFITNKILPAIQNLTDWFSNLSLGTQKVIFSTLAIIAALAPALLIIGKLTTSVGLLVKNFSAVSKALSAIAAHPVILIIGVVVGLLALLYSKNEEFRASINRIFETIKGSLMPVLTILGKTFSNIVSAIMPIINTLMETLVPVLVMVSDTFGSLLGAILPIISTLITSFLPIINSMIPAFLTIVKLVGLFSETFVKAILPFLSQLIGLMVPVYEYIAKKFIPIIEELGKVWQKIFEAIPKMITITLYVIENMVNGVIDFINNLIKQINKLGSIIGLTIKELDNISFASNIEKKITINSQKGLDSSSSPTKQPVSPTQVIGDTPSFYSNNTNITNDYSKKDITLNLTIENYAAELDYDDIFKQINIKLAEQF